MNVEKELKQVHAKICRATNPIDHMLIRRKFWRSNVQTTITMLKSSIKQLEYLLKNISKGRD